VDITDGAENFNGPLFVDLYVTDEMSQNLSQLQREFLHWYFHLVRN
jgi:hypothetical protein